MQAGDAGVSLDDVILAMQALEDATLQFEREKDKVLRLESDLQERTEQLAAAREEHAAQLAAACDERAAPLAAPRAERAAPLAAAREEQQLAGNRRGDAGPGWARCAPCKHGRHALQRRGLSESNL